MADVAIIAPEVASAPQAYTLPGAQEILLRAVGCQINGANAAGSFLPALQMLDPAGHVMWTAVNRSLPVAAGGSALVSWFPGGGVDHSTGSSGVTAVTSPLATISVSNSSGPTVGVDLPLTGVTAGSYGDSSHSAAITVDAEGRLTAASSQAIVPSPAAGNIVAYGTHTADQSTSNTNFAGGQDLLTSAISFTADGSSDYQALVTGSFWIPTGNTASFMRCSLNLDGSEAGFMTEQSVSGQAGFAFVFSGAAFIPAPSAASHTVNARIYAGAAGIVPITVKGGTGGAGVTAIVVWVVKL